MKGKFIVFEGIDGAGCGTQTENLKERLNAILSQPVLHLRYPTYNDPIGVSIHEFLHKKFYIGPDIQFLLYSINILKDMDDIRDAQSRNRVILADRYFTTTLSYQCAQGFPEKKALSFARLFNVVKPDVVFYLKISPDVSVKRKRKEKVELDRYEENKKFQDLVSKRYDDMAKRNIFAKKWIIINGEKGIEEISDEIFSMVKKYLRI
ncbi:MAG: dTMP kinase [Candidatus Aenigmarchaeota archaeon]|nr:dTMP kinase [Candidatus Aenigmarchaeota archaeon]